LDNSEEELVPKLVESEPEIEEKEPEIPDDI
jgi:hypothetical protein